VKGVLVACEFLGVVSDIYKNLKRFGFVPLTGGCVSLLKQLSMHEAMFGKNNPPPKKQVKCQVKSSALWQEMVAAYPRAETNKSHSWWFQHVSTCFNMFQPVQPVELSHGTPWKGAAQAIQGLHRIHAEVQMP
jgi:hypothetical protein